MQPDYSKTESARPAGSCKEQPINKVEVRLYASLRKYHPAPDANEALIIDIDDKANLRDLLNELTIPREEVHIFMINGKWEEEDYPLGNGDRIGLFPPIGGG